MQEFIKRLRIGLSLVIGFFTGKHLAVEIGHHASEFFIGGFMMGFIVSQSLFKLYDSFTRPSDPPMP
jgi:hypothetical protein